MQFSVVSLLSLAAVAVAQSTVVGFNTGVPSVVTVGVPVDLPYHAPFPVIISLRQGPASNLNKGIVLISGSSNGNYRWIPKNLVSGSNYALQISNAQGSETNYFGPIRVIGSPASSSSSTSSSSVSSTSMSSSSSSAAPSYTPPVVQTPGAVIPPAHMNRTSSTSSVAAPSGSANPAPYPVPFSHRNTTTPSVSRPTQTGSNAAAISAPSGSGASQLGSSFALVVGIVAAFAYLN